MTSEQAQAKESQNDAASETVANYAFQADVARLLDLMVHSIYSDREIFLRELISNAADACEKLRYEALSDPNLLPPDHHFNISLNIDKAAKILSVSDNGIGMSKQDLISALGSIASSGTRAFMEKVQRPSAGEDRETDGGSESGANLIGQFGIGFYSAFIVADHVDVETRRAGETSVWRWSSDGKGEYSIEAAAPESLPSPGTRVSLHLRDDAIEFLETYKIETIVKKHSQSITVPVSLTQASDLASAEVISSGQAIWTKPKTEISGEEYTAFYLEISKQFDEPALTAHWRAEGRYEYTVLAYVPGSKPFDLFEPDRKDRSRLYVRRVLISDDCNLLPGWLRFIRLIVDAPDIPLNVSRELIQQTPAFNAIRKAITSRILQELSKLAQSDSERFQSIWNNFGPVLKEGLYEDAERRDQLYEICRFTTSQDSTGTRTLKDYVSGLKDNQTAIYYIAGDNATRLGQSPQLEGFRKRGVEVLLLSDPVDSFWVSNALGYDGKPFKSVTQGAADIESIPLAEGEQSPEETETSPSIAALFTFMKQTLAEVVDDVRSTNRLAESPACIVASDSGLDRRLEKILADHGKLDALTKPVLEINPQHPLVEQLARKLAADNETSIVEDATWLIFEEARLMEGDRPSDNQAFRQRLFRILINATGP